MQAHDFEPMSIGRILDRTFKIYKDNFIRFVTIVAIIQVPITLLTIVSMSFLQRGVFGRSEAGYERSEIDTRQIRNMNAVEDRTRFDDISDDEDNYWAVFIGGVGIFITGVLSMLGRCLCRGALIKSVSELYLGNEISVGQAYRFVWPKFLTLIFAGILVVLMIYLGLLLLVVPGILFGLWFALTTPAIVVENLKATEGMSRSKALASGNLGKIFSVAFLTMVIAWVVVLPFQYIGIFLSRLLFLDNIVLMNFVNQLAALVGQILVSPIMAITYILLYYDLRIRKEGFDLVMLANSIGSGQGDINVSPQ
jgi:hypothetical protein